MSFQVNIYSDQEKQKYKASMTVPVTAGNWDKWGNLHTNLKKPHTNLLSRKTWIQQVARCIELSMTKEEFIDKVEADYQRHEKKITFFLNDNKNLKRSDLVKDNAVNDYSWFFCTSGGGYRRGLSHKEMISVRNLLRW